jgi:hypothetical protein
MSDLSKKLTTIQNELKAPKSQYNNFGKYPYRNCEDILEAVKPHLLQHGLTLTISDEMVEVAGRVYVKATCTIKDGKGGPGAEISNSAFAREDDGKKGMDHAQLTGATSSYARKYALNGLFLIDDTKDADSMDNSNQGTPKQQAPADDKEWYNNFDKDKESMTSAIATGDRTADQIITNLRKKFKLSNKVADQIKGIK